MKGGHSGIDHVVEGAKTVCGVGVHMTRAHAQGVAK